MIIDDNEVKLYRPGQRPKKKFDNFFGFDVETDTKKDNQEIILWSLNGKNFSAQGRTISEFKKEIKKQKYRGAWICAHNLMFDFHAVFKGDDLAFFNRMYSKGGSLLTATTYIVDDNFVKNPEREKKKHKLTFIDTMNYARMKLKDIGKIINEQKLDWDFNYNHPMTFSEFIKFSEYNMQDSKIARKFMEFLADAFFSFGSNIKLTIASTAEKIFRNCFLKNIYRQHTLEEMDFIFKGYYGGRVEVYRRGYIKRKSYMYDFNSLYPSVMKDFAFPDPNSKHFIMLGDMNKIMNYEGFAYCRISVPKSYRCILPFKAENKKLLFPHGEIEGVWSHYEIRRALKENCRIIFFGKMLYYTKTCQPFSEYVDFFYKKRLEYESINSPMSFVCKILLNSLYGKFAQRYGQVDEFLHVSEVAGDIESLGNDFEILADNVTFRVKHDRKPARFCFPCWSAYVTSYARIKLYDKMIDLDGDFGDTDSIVTSLPIKSSRILGELKLEHQFDEMIVIKPKMYALNINGVNAKCKGLNMMLDFSKFHSMISKSTDRMIVNVKKFIKFKEAARRCLKINSVIEFNKSFSLEDTKRVWQEQFALNEWQDSSAPEIINTNNHKINNEILYNET